MIVGADDTVQDTALAVLGRALEQGEVLLSTGKVARVHRTNALHDVRVDQLLTQAGYHAHGVDAVTGAHFRALLAVATLDGKPVVWPRGQRAAMDAWISRFTSGDADRITGAYCILQGFAPAPATTPASGKEGAAPR